MTPEQKILAILTLLQSKGTIIATTVDGGGVLLSMSSPDALNPAAFLLTGSTLVAQ